MKTIRLLCHTAGKAFGDVVEVGSKEGQFDAKEAKALIEDGLAEEVKAVVTSKGDSALETRVSELSSELDSVNAKLAELEATNETLLTETVELGDKLVDAEAKVSDLEAEVTRLKAENAELAKKKKK